jgi:hypothetical protein
VIGINIWKCISQQRAHLGICLRFGQRYLAIVVQIQPPVLGVATS